jgi:hypothetical protein
LLDIDQVFQIIGQKIVIFNLLHHCDLLRDASSHQLLDSRHSVSDQLFDIRIHQENGFLSTVVCFAIVIVIIIVIEGLLPRFLEITILLEIIVIREGVVGYDCLLIMNVTRFHDFNQLIEKMFFFFGHGNQWDGTNESWAQDIN